jgi:hypothetical protein
MYSHSCASNSHDSMIHNATATDCPGFDEALRLLGLRDPSFQPLMGGHLCRRRDRCFDSSADGA